jgi:hypothetical protein
MVRIATMAMVMATAPLAAPLVSADESSAATHGRAIEKLPAKCDTLGYLDVYQLARSKVAKQDASLVRDRIHDSAALLPGAERWQSTLARLHDRGFATKNIDEIAVCANDKTSILTVAGDFGSKPLVGTLVKAGEKPGDDNVFLTSRDGRDFATIREKGRTVYALELAPGVLGVSESTADLAAAAKQNPIKHPELDPVSFGNGVAYARTRTRDGRAVTAKLENVGGSYALTAVESKKGAFDPVKDRQRWISGRDAWAAKLRQTPFAPLADDVARAPINATKNELRIRIVVPTQKVADAIANAAKAPNRDFEPLKNPPTAVGGGPSGP